MRTASVLGIGVVALSLSLNVVLLLGGRAEAGKAQTVGTVDLAAIDGRLKASERWQSVSAQLTEARANFRAEMQRLTRERYLTRDERTELRSLKAKPTPTPTDRKRIEALEAQSNLLDREYQELAKIERPTEPQQIRLVELKRLRETGLEALKDQSIVNSRRVTSLEEDLFRVEHKRVQEAAAEVARQNQLELVVDRQLVLYGGQDVTANLLQHLALK